jgi:hypothetical protein
MEITIGSHKFRIEMLILMAVLVWIIAGHVLCGCCRVNIMEGLENKVAAIAAGQKKKADNASETTESTDSTTTTTEGFTSSSTTTGSHFADANGAGHILNPSTWNAPTSTSNRPSQPIPLPEGELSMFATTEFKPECCPNAYSTSTGCACMTDGQYNYLKSRGGNNVPVSQY